VIVVIYELCWQDFSFYSPAWLVNRLTEMSRTHTVTCECHWRQWLTY